MYAARCAFCGDEGHRDYVCPRLIERTDELGAEAEGRARRRWAFGKGISEAVRRADSLARLEEQLRHLRSPGQR